MKTLKKSSQATQLKYYYSLRAEYCYCPCSTFCASETSSWYPMEAHANESYTVLSVNHNRGVTG